MTHSEPYVSNAKKESEKNYYKFGKFSNGWWSIIYFDHMNNWGKWRGPFKTKIEAQLDACAASRGRYTI